MRPVENLSVPVDPMSCEWSFPLTPTPLGGRGVGVAVCTSRAVPFIVVIERPESWEFSFLWRRYPQRNREGSFLSDSQCSVHLDRLQPSAVVSCGLYTLLYPSNCC